METKPISPKWHALINCALAGNLTTLPSLLKMKRKTKLTYVAEVAILLLYIALTKQPALVKGLIPFKTHGKIDPFNVAQFAAQSLLPVFRNKRKELLFNLAFTTLVGVTVLLTDFKRD
jgi:hypothetical protein